MLKIGITGGIGSGKTWVCRAFETLGIPVYYADERARALIHTHPEIIAGMKQLFGEDIYTPQGLDKKKVAALIFSETKLRHKLNALTHPVVMQDAADWMAVQKAPYLLKEAALLLESGSYKQLDKIVGVFAPLEIRVERVMQRDAMSQDEVLQRINGQMPEEEKMSRCDFIIDNSGTQALLPQIWALHQQWVAGVIDG